MSNPDTLNNMYTFLLPFNSSSLCCCTLKAKKALFHNEGKSRHVFIIRGYNIKEVGRSEYNITWGQEQGSRLVTMVHCYHYCVGCAAMEGGKDKDLCTIQKAVQFMGRRVCICNHN